MDGFHIRSGRFEDQKNLDMEPRFLDRPHHSLVTIHFGLCYTLNTSKYCSDL
jgi:hypothetical protein